MPVAPAAAGYAGYAVGVGFQYQLRGRARRGTRPDLSSSCFVTHL